MGSKQDNIDNELVRLKDELLEMVNAGDERNLTNALTILSRLVGLWRALDYGYKGREIVLRVKQMRSAVTDHCPWNRMLPSRNR